MPSVGILDYESFDNPLRWFPDLTAAIERNPIIVDPDTPLLEVISLISQAHNRCSLEALSPLETENSEAQGQPNSERLAGCVLVMEGADLRGILTERDVVRLTAAAIDCRTVTVATVMTSPVVTLTEQAVQDVFAALFLLRRYRIRHLPILDNVGAVVGVVSHASLRRVLKPANLLRFRRVADVMSTQVVQASLATPVLTLARLMANHHVSCVVITQVDEEGYARPVGIMTERDIVQFQSLQLDLANTPAYDLMSTPLFLLSPQDSLWVAQREMQRRHVGRLVVSWDWGRGMGIVTQTSLLRVFDPMEMYSVIENLQQTIQELQGPSSAPSPQPLDGSPERLALNLEHPALNVLESFPPAIPSPTSQDVATLQGLLAHTVSTLDTLVTEPNPSSPMMKTRLIHLLKQLRGA
jgi:CBS domain-containing protein